MDVIDLGLILAKRKEKAKEDGLNSRIRAFHALHAELTSVISKHERYGILPLGIVGVCVQLLSDYMVKMDPYLKNPGLREILFNYIDSQTEEKLLAYWEENGVDAPKEDV